MTQVLTIEQAYRAMHHFVEAYWERGGKRGDELTLFLSYSAVGTQGRQPFGNGRSGRLDRLARLCPSRHGPWRTLIEQQDLPSGVLDFLCGARCQHSYAC
jgi:hypothetical protein